MAEDDKAREGLSVDTGFKELEIVAFTGDFKIIGMAHFGVGHRASSRRSSDYLRQFSDSRLTLSKVRIYSKATQELLETTDDGIETVAAAAGMGTATTLRRHFHRTVGVPPDTYRRTFRT